MRIFNCLVPNFLAVATVAVAAVASIPPTAVAAERVCRQDCVGPVCKERCVETEGRGDRRERWEGREERREERRERRPGIELRAPRVDVEVGR